MKLSNLVKLICSLCLCFLCCSCAEKVPKDFSDTLSYLDHKSISRTWLTKKLNGKVEIVGQASDEIGHSDDSCTEATLTVRSEYCGAPLYYIIPVRFASKEQCRDFLRTGDEHKTVRVIARPNRRDFMVSQWTAKKKLANDSLPHGGDIPCPWGEYHDKFPQGVSKRGVVKIKPFKSIAYEGETANGKYSYQTLTSGKVCSVPVLMSITVLSEKPIKNLEPDYYNFKKVKVINGKWVSR